ncbi:hypothetical protein OnM2_071059 [Erysiphe neolycopersici]|uniref:Uncharacterized protein n=1 Tax=Erysiphe neolycopersici TaxID=212602 RepID=A0A420HK42_9PEZI|nr:hypothetical protein OnM2_071059 [Erysiphe neolycopersici]
MHEGISTGLTETPMTQIISLRILITVVVSGVPNARIQSSEFHNHWWFSTTTDSTNVTGNTGQEENVGIILEPTILLRRIFKAQRMVQEGRVNSTTRATSTFEKTAPNNPNSLNRRVQRGLLSPLVTEETPQRDEGHHDLAVFMVSKITTTKISAGIRKIRLVLIAMCGGLDKAICRS